MNVRIVPWLQDFSLSRTYGLDEVTDQVTAARRAKAGGFMLWNPLGVYTRKRFRRVEGSWPGCSSQVPYTAINHGTLREAILQA